MGDELAMRRHRPISDTDIGVEISRITGEMPSLGDIDRIHRRLDANGCRFSA